MNKISPKKVWIIVVILLVGVVLACLYWYLSFSTRANSVEKMEKITNESLCLVNGGKWRNCGESFGPCGCAKIFKDGDKLCISGNECLAGKCIVGVKILMVRI